MKKFFNGMLAGLFFVLALFSTVRFVQAAEHAGHDLEHGGTTMKEEKKPARLNEDANGNGVLDPGEDLNGNGKLDQGVDKNGNGKLDKDEIEKK